MDQRPWRVRCGYWLPPSEETQGSPRPRGDGSVWAKDEAGRRLVAEGRIEDGFFVVGAIRAASDIDDRVAVDVAATEREVTRACAIALDEEVLGEQPRLHTIAVTRAGEGIDVPLVFPQDPQLPRPVSRMVVFGDSLSDSGNLKRRLLVFPNTPYWLGRFSDGPNWTEYLAQRSSISVLNQAFGGAVAVRHDDLPGTGVIAAIEQGAQFFLTGSIHRQVEDYLQGDLAGAGLQNPEEVAFVLWGGANDYISKEPFSGAIRTLLDDPNGKAGYVRLVNETVDSLTEQVRLLYAAGGRRFVVLNLPNLGKTPIVLQNRSYAARETKSEQERLRVRLSKRLGDLTAFHNRQLARSLAKLGRELPDATMVTVDSAKVVDRILRGVAPDGSGVPFDYGFALREREEPLRSGDTRLRLQQRCYDGGYLGSLSDAVICEQWKNAMFWDVVHPTSYMHCWIAYVVQREMARRGLAATPSSAAEHRAYCTARTQPVSQW